MSVGLHARDRSFVPRPLGVPPVEAFAPGRARVARAVLVAAALVLASIFPFFPNIHSANEMGRLFVAEAILQDGTVAIDAAMKRWHNVPDKARRDGKSYCDKAPGVSFVILPFIAAYHAVVSEPTLEGQVRIARLVAATLPFVVMLFMLLSWLGEYIPSERLRVLLVVVAAFGTVMTPYSVLLFGHALNACLVFGLFMLLRRTGPDCSPARAAAIGAVASASLCVEYSSAIPLFVLGVYFLVRVRLKLTPVLVAAVAMVPFLVLLGAYHDAAFGSPFATGYQFLQNGYFKQVHEQGLMGLTWPTLGHFAQGFLSPSKGLLFFSPVLILSFFGLHRLRGEDRVLSLILVSWYVFFISSMAYPGGGWTVSQRHLVPMVPWLIVPLGLFVQAKPKLRTTFYVLLWVSVTSIGVSTIVWPYYFDDLVSPLGSLGFPLFRDGWRPPSTWNLVRISIDPILVLVAVGLVAAVTADARTRWPARWEAFAVSLFALSMAVLWVGGVEALSPRQASAMQKDRSRVEKAYVLEHGREPAFQFVPRGGEAERLESLVRGATATLEVHPPRPNRSWRCKPIASSDVYVECTEQIEQPNDAANQSDDDSAKAKRVRAAKSAKGRVIKSRWATREFDGDKAHVLRIPIERGSGTYRLRLKKGLQGVSRIGLHYEDGTPTNARVRGALMLEDGSKVVENKSFASLAGAELEVPATLREGRDVTLAIRYDDVTHPAVLRFFW